MKVSLKQINGPWDQGWVLDKHMVSSTFLGNDDRGHPCFDNQRTEIGEATSSSSTRRIGTRSAHLLKP